MMPTGEHDTGDNNTLGALLRRQSLAQANRPAFLAPGRNPLTWSGLNEMHGRTVRRLGELGFAPNDRIAAVLPDGPVMASAFLAIGSCATFAPLNPAYTVEEFAFYLDDLRARAVVLPGGVDSPARFAAHKLKVPILELSSREGALAGEFELNPAAGTLEARGKSVALAGPDDVALVLHTSGTTSRPKQVPLTQRNLSSSARHIAATLALSAADRCLCVMPLFHIHGLVGALLSSLAAGAAVVCTPGFAATRFFEWLAEFEPTWYTAVPTMHQAVLARALESKMIAGQTRLRLIRSSSAALPPQVMSGLEAAFGVPVIESYGMTEASHQMASNPLPPRSRKPGSVGPAAGPEVAIMDDAGCILAAGAVGEIVIKGPNVTRGYENNPAANVAAFTNGWFRTGDQGRLDADGYLFITGRLKELINRGGEKVAPREIDEVLLNHPGVRHAVAFAMQHPTLGEDIAAAVVPHEGAVFDEAALREFAARHLPAFKVPSRIVSVSELPKGPTGKLQRIGLADRLVDELAVAYEAPQGGLEELAAATISTVLSNRRVGRLENFFSLGGDSIRAMQVVARLADSLGLEVPPAALFQHPTVASLAAELARLKEQQEVDLLAAELAQLPSGEAARLLEQTAREARPGVASNS